MTSRASGPAWVGIGAQRSGTTWFTDLFTQHPRVGLGHNGRKEQHFFDTAVVDGWGEDDAAGYRDLFAGDPAVLRGEFTPAYLRLPQVPALLRSACPSPPLLIVLLRDPIDRFHSAMRWYARQREERAGRRSSPRTHRQFTEQAVWAGMYATHLEVWSEVFERDRFVVIQYEAVRDDAAAAVGPVLDRLGLEPIILAGAGFPSATSTGGAAGPAPPGLDDALMVVYRREVGRLGDAWGIDPSLWPNFA
jgi:hypothetical protein